MVLLLTEPQIMESMGFLPYFEPERNEDSWQQFVAAVPACAPFVGTNNTFACLRDASTSDLEQAIVTTQINFANLSFTPAGHRRPGRHRPCAPVANYTTGRPTNALRREP